MKPKRGPYSRPLANHSRPVGMSSRERKEIADSNEAALQRDYDVLSQSAINRIEDPRERRQAQAVRDAAEAERFYDLRAKRRVRKPKVHTLSGSRPGTFRRKT